MKPLDPNVLKTRVEALLRRSSKEDLSIAEIVVPVLEKMEVPPEPKKEIPPLVTDFSQEKVAAEAFRAELEKRLSKAQPEFKAQAEPTLQPEVLVGPAPQPEVKIEPPTQSEPPIASAPLLETHIEPPPLSEPAPKPEPKVEETIVPTEESVLTFYKKIETEDILKAEASAKLNLPNRKKITQANPQVLYESGHQIFNELMKAGGDFGPEEFLLITTYCDKLAEISTANNELLSLALAVTKDPNLATHCVNCAIIALRIGRNLQIQAGDLPLLGIASLLLDLGMTKVDSRIYNKRGELTPSERNEVMNHVQYGLELVEKAIKKDFPQECAYITTGILQHHERQEGQGYPHKLTGDKISRQGKIIGLADTFEAMCHARFHRIRQTTYHALQEVVGMKKTYFDPIILRALVNELTFFPIGCYVRLNTDEIGVVIDTSTVHSMRPKVKILTDAEGVPLDIHKTVDLVQAPFLYVVKPLDDDDVPELG
jgi:HD-GYP domain-containing protein (c-di-GMP phosphodiesterase class II)